MKNSCILDLQSKEVRIQDPPTRPASYSNLSLVQLLRSGLRPAQIAAQLKVPKTTLQYHLDQLKRLGVVSKCGYGVWEVLAEPPKEVRKTTQVGQDKTDPFRTSSTKNSNFSTVKPDTVRAHAFMLTLKVPKGLRNWTGEMRRRFLLEHGLDFTPLRIAGGGQRIIFKGRKVWLTNPSVILFDRASYFANTSKDSKQLALYKLFQLVRQLERALDADFTERAGRQYRFKVSKQHYALVKNALAEQYDAEGKKLQVRTTKGLWFVIDNSFNLHEAETVHAETADLDNLKVQDFFNSLKEYPITTDFVLRAMNGIQQNQVLFAENIHSHIRAIQDLSFATKELVGLLERSKGHYPRDFMQTSLATLGRCER
ncbi:MAG TPA: ArsR family transcriptional regulator [Methanomicrobia archaeon]|nr:ArsR family transcriptional regulator [Methanomicrobia archaeon]